MGNSPGPVNSPRKWPVTRKMFPFDDVIMIIIIIVLYICIMIQKIWITTKIHIFTKGFEHMECGCFLRDHAGFHGHNEPRVVLYKLWHDIINSHQVTKHACTFSWLPLATQYTTSRGPRHQIASRLNARWQTDWAIKDQAIKLELNSPSLWSASIQPTWPHCQLTFAPGSGDIHIWC